jgi:glycosyltransferase involved in cell wall biosynthesis
MGYTQVDPAELARQIEKLAADPEMSARLGARGRAAWEERFSWSTIYRSYEKIIEDCLERVTP